MPSRLRVVIFSGASNSAIVRLLDRIHREVPEAHVCGILRERRSPKRISRRVFDFIRRLPDREFVGYVISRLGGVLSSMVGEAGSILLRLIHGGGPAKRNQADDLRVFSSLDCRLHTTSDYHGADALAFVRNLKAHLGIAYGTRILKPRLFTIPRLGSINIHKRRVPQYRGGGPVGLWELLDGESEIGVTVHQVTERLDAGAVVNATTIPIEPYDNLESLALKAHLIGNDLLVRSVREFARGEVAFAEQCGTGRLFKAPDPQQLRRLQKKIATKRPQFRPSGSRPTAKMLAKSFLALPRVTIRNWKRRIDGRFPVNILFHHIVTDRRHRLGISTDHFLKHVKFLQKHYEVVSLDEAIEMLEKNAVRRPTVVLTFDDGYSDNFVNLRAVVEQTGVPVTLFVSSDHIQRGNEFKHDVEHGYQGFVPLTWPQLRLMQINGFQIGSHTKTHFDCGTQNPVALENEIAGSKEELERHLGVPVRFFSFPFGLPENICPQAAHIASRTYPFVFSAYGGENFAARHGVITHLRRWCHPNRIWDLELQIQGVLEEPMGSDYVDESSATARPERPVSFAEKTVPR